MQVQPSIEDAYVHPAVARSDRGARSLDAAPRLVLRNPRRDEVRPVRPAARGSARPGAELVEARIVPSIGREVVERVPVRARADVAGRQAALGRSSPRWPTRPTSRSRTRASCVQRRGAVDERAQLADRLAPEALDPALGDDREAVGHREAHHAARHGERVLALLGVHVDAVVADRPEHVLILRARAARGEGSVIGH